MGKRGPNEGSTTQRSDGRWMARLNLGYDANGKRQRKCFYGKTRKEVAAQLVAAQRDLQQGLPVAVERQTIAQFLDRWLNDVAKHTVRASTFESYGRRIARDIVPLLGRTALAKLTPQDFTRLYSALLGRGLSPRTVQYDHAVLHRALEQAVRWNLIPRNPADAVDAPRPKRPEIRVLSPEEIGRFLPVSREDRLHALYLLALMTGMRQGELLGLKWADLDWQAGALHVRRQATRTKANGIGFSDPKTSKARRTIPLPVSVVDELRRHRTAQLEQRLLAGQDWTDLDLVFPNAVGKPIEKQNLMRRSFKPLLERAGLPPIRFHDLRHSAATLMLSQGDNPKVVQERLGHAAIGITLDVYSHVLPSMQRESADKLDAFLRGIP